MIKQFVIVDWKTYFFFLIKRVGAILPPSARCVSKNSAIWRSETKSVWSNIKRVAFSNFLKTVKLVLWTYVSMFYYFFITFNVILSFVSTLEGRRKFMSGVLPIYHPVHICHLSSSFRKNNGAGDGGTKIPTISWRCRQRWIGSCHYAFHTAAWHTWTRRVDRSLRLWRVSPPHHSWCTDPYLRMRTARVSAVRQNNLPATEQ